jgi:hypothetical protein
VKLIKYFKRFFQPLKAMIADWLLTQLISTYPSIRNAVNFSRTYKDDIQKSIAIKSSSGAFS